MTDVITGAPSMRSTEMSDQARKAEQLEELELGVAGGART